MKKQVIASLLVVNVLSLSSITAIAKDKAKKKIDLPSSMQKTLDAKGTGMKVMAGGALVSMSGLNTASAHAGGTTGVNVGMIISVVGAAVSAGGTTKKIIETYDEKKLKQNYRELMSLNRGAQMTGDLPNNTEYEMLSRLFRCDDCANDKEHVIQFATFLEKSREMAKKGSAQREAELIAYSQSDDSVTNQKLMRTLVDLGVTLKVKNQE